LKRDYQILIIFGTNIPETTGHQMTVQVTTSPNICFCTTWGKENKLLVNQLANRKSIMVS